MEPGSLAQAIASNTQCTHRKAGFTGIGGAAEALHESVDATLADKPERTIRATANGRSDVEGVT